ncbi:MAG: hypothetical protein ACQEW9_00135 [Bacteroidota bacterium]
MKSLFKSLASFILLFFCFSTLVSAQKSLQDIAELNDKKWDKLVVSYKNAGTWIDQLEGLLSVELVSEDNLPNPKKIGVLTMQIWDYSQTSSSKVAQTTVYTKNFLTPDGGNLVADTFMETILPIYEEKFQKKGITLLEPKEYLTDDEKRRLYEEGPSRIEVSGLVKTLGAINSFLTNADKGQGSATATGYEFYPTSPSTLFSDYKSSASLGLLVEDLGLDAVLVLSVELRLVKNGKSMVLNGIQAGLVGPIDDDESKEYKGRIGAGMMNMYRDGMPFSVVSLRVEPFEIAKLSKSGSIEEWYLDGLDVVTERMATDLIRGMEKFIALDKSKD